MQTFLAYVTFYFFHRPSTKASLFNFTGMCWKLFPAAKVVFENLFYTYSCPSILEFMAVDDLDVFHDFSEADQFLFSQQLYWN